MLTYINMLKSYWGMNFWCDKMKPWKKQIKSLVLSLNLSPFDNFYFGKISVLDLFIRYYVFNLNKIHTQFSYRFDWRDSFGSRYYPIFEIKLKFREVKYWWSQGKVEMRFTISIFCTCNLYCLILPYLICPNSSSKSWIYWLS